MEIYLDNSATTRSYDSVASLVAKVMCEDYGNAASLHKKGVEAERYIKKAKEIIAANLKVAEKEIYFTSGGTESDNLALIGTATANYRRGRHLITTEIEHPAILQTMKYLEGQGFTVTYLPVNACGQICLTDLENAITAETILVSIMHTNNEIGSIQPIEEAAAVIKRCNSETVFHVDAVQGFGKCRIYPKRVGIDLLSVSGHKIHGPKGVGFLYVGAGVKIRPIGFGGDQQGGLRSGTENVPGIAGLGRAVEEIYGNLEEERAFLQWLKDYFIQGLSQIEQVRINGAQGVHGAPHIVSASFVGVRSEVLLHSLEERGIYVSAGSACSAKRPTPSRTLKAIGLEQAFLESTIRFSTSVFTTKEEIDYTLQAIYDMIPMLRRYSRY